MIDITLNLKKEKEYEELRNALFATRDAQKKKPLLAVGLSEGAEFAFLNCIISDYGDKTAEKSVLIVPDEKKANRLLEAFLQYGKKAYFYTERDFVFHNMAASHEFEHERLNVLSAICEKDYDIIITTPDAALQFTIPKSRLLSASMEIDRNREYEISEIVDFLERSGYKRTDVIDGVGQYAVRGGIIDIFSPAKANPVRIDFFGSEIDRMSYFDTLTQRSIEDCDKINVLPAREVIGYDKESLIKLIKTQIKKVNDTRIVEILNEEISTLEAGGELYSVDKYISFVYPEQECLLDYITDDLIILSDYNSITDREKAKDWHNNQAIIALLEEGAISSKYAKYSKDLVFLSDITSKNQTIIVNPFITGLSLELGGIFNFKTRQTINYSGKHDMLCEDLQTYLIQGYKIDLLTENETQANNLIKLLSEKGFTAAKCKDSTIYGEINKFGKPQIRVIFDQNILGFELNLGKYILLSLIQSGAYITARQSAAKRKKKDKNLQRIMSYADLDVGDYVVHATHGIGQYLGLSSLVVEGVRRDFIKIKYAGTDMLYLPCDQLEKISKYIGARSEDGTLKLSKMGGADWNKSKQKAKKAAKDMAKELIKLYAERVRKPGFAFLPDDVVQREFEEAFEYEETEGQLRAAQEIKEDMERPYPMDRLLCGDVGYGKTEVALRAAFKAVLSSKQTAILVPTTILALQHYQTMLSRMRGFPVNIDMVSRFKTASQIQESLRKLRRGETDIIVGTHRLLSDDVKFKDLGLLIIDEEQRFGVAHKEKLKKLSENVDVLTLTATPIPRTLSMAMSGIRDMSILEEAPDERMPVQTYVLEYDDIIISEAIKKELRRGGQVFYLCNRIEKMDRIASKVASFVPDARIEIAHGQMDKDRLSDIWQAMVSGEIDVLVSTTIIETGIDVPNANTLIIEDADKMGLSQLHQLRGRVGRSSRRAYAYFTYPKNRVLTEVSEKRLSAIRDFTEFGAGFKIALRDLEIRGAGNILGAEQHGHMASIGYDLYMKILNEAILEEKGEKVVPKTECTVEVNISAYIPETYIKNANQRIDTYKKISLIENEEDMRDIYDELTDRYGTIPDVTYNILKISLIRAMGSSCNVVKIERKSDGILFYPEKINVEAWMKLAAENKGKVLLSLGQRPYATLRYNNKTDCGGVILDSIIEILKKYIQIIDKIGLKQDGKN